MVNVGLSIEALEIAIENNLTILGTSDVHGIANWEFEQYGGHRPMTFVLCEDNDINSIIPDIRIEKPNISASLL